MRDPNLTTFYFVVLNDAAGNHLATETIWTPPGTTVEGILDDAGTYFGADDNGAYEPEQIAAGTVLVYGPFTLGDAKPFKLTLDEDSGVWTGRPATDEDKAEPDLLGEMMEWEGGDLDEEREDALFQRLVDNGMAWTLQGAYGRHARRLIDAGRVTGS